MSQTEIRAETLRERMGVDDSERLACPRLADAPVHVGVSLGVPTAIALLLALVVAIA